MQLQQALELIGHPVTNDSNIWADLGCGDGLFTNALSQLLLGDSLIYAIDKSKQALARVSVKNNIRLVKIQMDFIQTELPLHDLSAILMANSFHFVHDKVSFIEKVSKYLNTSGYFLFVEYDTDVANAWVPYPVSFHSLREFFAGFNYQVTKLNELRSRYNRMLYSAIVEK